MLSEEVMLLRKALQLFGRIESERLLLRRVEINDLEDIFEFVSDEQITKEAGWPQPYSRKEEERHLILKYISYYNSEKIRDWGVVLKSNQKLIGLCGFLIDPPDENEPDIGFLFNCNYWNQGYATESVKTVIEFGFKNTSIKTIFAECTESNKASQKVLQNCGLKREIASETEKVKFSILRAEYENSDNE